MARVVTKEEFITYLTKRQEERKRIQKERKYKKNYMESQVDDFLYNSHSRHLNYWKQKRNKSF